MSLHQNIGNGTFKEITKLSQNIGGSITKLNSFKINIDGTHKELLDKEILTSGTIITIWTAIGSTSITTQNGGSVTAVLSSGSSMVATNANRIYSSTFFAEKETVITFNTDGHTPDGPVVAFLVDSGGSSTTIGSRGSSVTVPSTGYYHLVIVGSGVTGSSSGSTTYVSTTMTNARFTFTGGLSYIGATSSIYYTVWTATGSSKITSQAGGELSGTIYAGTVGAPYSNRSIYSNKFFIEAGSTITFTGTISPSGPFQAYLVDSNESVTTIGASGSSITITAEGYYHLALSGCGVTGSSSGATPTSGTFTASFVIT